MSEPAPEPPDLEQLLKMSQGLTGPAEQAIETMSAVHARWYRAWIENDIPEHRAAELLRVMVAAGCGASLIISG